MPLRSRIVVFFASIPIVTFTLLGYYGRVAAGEEEQTYRHLRVFEDVVSLISNNYVELVDLDDVLQGALRGLADGLDSDSAYLSPSEVRWLESGQELPAGRVGIEVTRRYYLQVIATRDGSPAADAGIAPGDYVRAIDGDPTRLLSVIEGKQRLHGEPGTAVTLSLIRGSTQEPYDIEIVRERLAAPVVAARLLAEADGVGYLRIPSFDEGTADAVAEHAARLEEEGAAHLVIDVRNAAEGAYDAAIETARLFVGEGTLAIREESDDSRTPLEATAGEDVIALPATLLTNFGSSGPAEVFAAALIEHERADAVGQRTAGRTSLQRLVPLSNGSGLWLSWARYLTGAGEAIHPLGIEPEIGVDPELPELGEPLPEEDAVLQRALDEIRGEGPEAAAEAAWRFDAARQPAALG